MAESKIALKSFLSRVNYDYSLGAFHCDLNSMYILFARYEANRPIKVSIKRNNVDYEVGTITQPNNNVMFAPAFVLGCQQNDFIFCSSNYEIQCFRINQSL